MKKIIIPTDFSPIAANAYAYAKEMAAVTNSPLKTIHFAHPTAHQETPIPSLEGLLISSKQKLDKFTDIAEQAGSGNVDTGIEIERLRANHEPPENADHIADEDKGWQCNNSSDDTGHDQIFERVGGQG